MSNKIYLGSTNLGTGKIRLGANDVSAIYLGSSLVYGGTTPPTPTDPDMLHFTAQQSNSTVALTPASGLNLTLYKSTDGVNFDSWDGSAVTLSNIGDTLWVYGNNQTLATNTSTYSYFVMTGQIAAAGDVTYLLQNGGLTTLTSNYTFACLFNSCSSLTTAPTLPATTLTQGCYSEMFEGCSNLTTAPTLPATTVPQGAYNRMFGWCSSLTTAPALPATTLGDSCYNMMFQYCTNLTTAPQLPATTVPAYGYKDMFRHCTSLTTAPALQATTLNSYCYENMFFNCTSLTTAPDLMVQTIPAYGYHQMFYGCSSLNSVTCLATNISATDCTNNWLYGVAQSGTFRKSTVPNWPTGGSGIPTGWTTQDVYTCADDWNVMGYNSEAECACDQDSDYMGHASVGDCMCNEFNECIDCSTDWETLGYGSEEDCNCQVYDDCIDCTGCNNWQDCGYSSYEECDCDVNGNCGVDECQECYDACEGDPDCEAVCDEGPCYSDPCVDVDCSDCSNWDNECCAGQYESYEDCDCQENGNCGEEEPEEEEPEP